ncbi:MAG: hypothetical protein LH472_08480 [Pyrinomonadaceae bacterium]|nr:hypothetical protein [Pyrinomonadaceae bacterium]
MSAKIVFDTKEEIREDLRDKAKEIDGKFELDAKGILSKNTELLGKNTALADKVEELESANAELKKSSKMPAGQKLVAADVAELGEAAQTAGLSTDEMPTLKTAAADLQKQIDGFAQEKVIAEVAANLGFNNRFILAARDKGLRFEKTQETADGKAVEVWNVKGEGDTKTKVEEFLKTDGYFKEFAETFKSDNNKSSGNTFDPAPAGVSDTLFDKIRKGAEEKKKNAPPIGSLRELAGVIH